MKKNDYDEAEVVEIGEAQSVVQGRKTTTPDIESSGMEPIDRHYEEE